MGTMIDASCPKCGKRFGWQGRMVDRPPCPRCGHQVPAEDLAKADAEMEAFRRLLATHPRDAAGGQLRAQRVAAGLTLHQAAGRVGIPARTLRDFEFGQARPTEAEAAKLAEAYGCGEG